MSENAKSNSGNTYKKVRALVSKTVEVGCTIEESTAAFNLASKIISEHKLDVTRISWPQAPAGYSWVGTPGDHTHPGKVVENAKPKPASKPKAKPAAKPKSSVAAIKPATPKAKGPGKVAVAEKPRKDGSKAAKLMVMLKDGTTIEAITKAFGILPHTARAMVSVEIRRAGATYTRKDGVYKLT
jgi:hypothetical protein